MIFQLKSLIKNIFLKENKNIYTQKSNYNQNNLNNTINNYYKYSEDSLSDIEADFCRKEAKNSLFNEKFTPKNFILKG